MLTVRGIKRGLNDRGRFKYKPPEAVVDFLIVGGGVVGLAIAQRLTKKFPRNSTIVVERHKHAGEEISSRNSEVIHAGLYYPLNSLKTKLCIRGRDLMYQRCKEHHIPYRMTGKLVVGRADQWEYLKNLHHKALETNRTAQLNGPVGQDGIFTELISGAQAREMEPDLSKDIDAALWSPKTGIVDSHSFMESLEKDIIDSEGGELVYSTRVVRVDPHERSKRPADTIDLEAAEDGWVVQTVTGASDSGDSMLARILINASGLSSTLVLNAILPKDSRIPMYYARGSYASYHGPGISSVSRLIYPCPDSGPNVHAFQSLGTHLTLDLQGKVRFGPDIEWLSPPAAKDDDLDEDDADFWMRHLIPDGLRVKEMHKAVMSYLPGVSLEGMQPDYVGVRPKLVPPGGGFQDFIIRTDYPTKGPNAGDTRGPMISLLGIESPGLTSSLAIADLVVKHVEKHIQ